MPLKLAKARAPGGLLASLNFEFAYVIFSSSYRAEAASLSQLAREEAERVAKLTPTSGIMFATELPHRMSAHPPTR